MELALLVYFASIVGSVSTFLSLFAFVLFFISVAFTIPLLVGNLGVKEYSHQSEEKLENQLKIKSILTKSVKLTIPFAIIFALISVLLPTERTVYLMTAAYATQTIAQNDRVQKISSDVLEVVEKKLSEMKGNSGENSNGY
ncbi:MAG: hypothetical protein RR623_01110 [Bacilli bacterium]